MGRRFMGVVRATFLVGADGRILGAWPKVNPIGHAKEVLAALRASAAGGRAPGTASGAHPRRPGAGKG
jgi:hypothetical protein